MTTIVEEQAVTICSLQLTSNAKEKLLEHFASEYKLFTLQRNFDVYIEKLPANKQGNTTYSIYFHNETNEQLVEQLQGKVAILDCIIKNEGFLATSFRLRGHRERVRTNRRLHVKLQFELNPRVAAQMPVELYVGLRQLPVAKERSEYVQKRIESWEGYLRIAEKNATIDDITASVLFAKLDRESGQLQIECESIQTKQRRKLEGMSVQIERTGQDIGQVVRVTKKRMDIQLNRSFQNRQTTDWLPKKGEQVVFSNFAELSQIRRLRLGFQQLQDGLAVNPKLERILFEERPPLRVAKKIPTIQFRNHLNEYQQEAIRGALQAEDLYVIQGPPGTGKTTVIAELCDQLVQAGSRVLIASQSNLAVDNALSRLLTDQDVRILRYGRTESIEEEGKRFIEENVALYWRDETVVAVEKALTTIDELTMQLQLQVASATEKVSHYTEKCNRLKERKAEQQKAEEQLAANIKCYEGLEKSVQQIEVEKEQLHSQQHALTESIKADVQKLSDREEAVQQLQVRFANIHTATGELSIAQYEAALQTVKMRHAIIEINHSIRWYANELDRLQYELKHWQNVREAIEAEKKWDALQKLTAYYRIPKTDQFSYARQQFIQLVTQFKANQFSAEYHEWKQTIPKLEKTIETMESYLQRRGVRIEQVEPLDSQQFRTIAEIHDMMEQLHRFLENYQQMSAHALSEQLQTRLKTNLAYLYGKRQEIVRKVRALDEAHRTELILQFEKVKQTIVQSIDRQDEQIRQAITEREQSMSTSDAEKNSLLQTYQRAYELLPIELQQLPEQQLSERVATFEEKNTEIERMKQDIAQAEQAIEKYTRQIQQYERTQEQLQEKNIKIVEKQQQFETEMEQLVAEQVPLHQIVEELLNEQLAEAISQIEEQQQLIHEAEKQLQELPIQQQLQKQWLELLQQSTDYDMDEIRKLYVAHANVIGTTCVASARKDFMDDYPEFDVVIIDEVSKATPPELLLPMLKGKKIVLVGDHHQLPPLVGQETIEELLEEHTDITGQQQLKKLLQESLFERLFHSVNEKSKSMLALQYRMHEKIMQTISPFYEHGRYALKCGLQNSDEVRHHGLETSWLKQSDHVVWVNTPSTPPYYEAKEQNGTSRFNESELRAIRKMVIDINDSVALAKQNGEIAADAKKSVGVISFYGEQVKRVNQLLFNELQLPHLQFRTGSVDKFQGMEMDIIIVSFVRNHGDKNGDIGFAKDYRRLNVALSRAKELLIIVGSIEMFTKKVKSEQASRMYERLVEIIEEQQGICEVEKLLL